MKKLLLIGIWAVIALVLVGCREQHVYHTYYKDIDVDTLLPIHDEDSSVFYVLEITKVDSTIAFAMGLEGMYEVIFYCPSKDEYSFQLYGSDGGESPRRVFNPETDSTFYNINRYGE